MFIGRLSGFDRRQQKQSDNRKKETSDFKSVLEEETRKRPKEVICVATGYTKDAKKADFLYDKREYL